MSEEAMALSVSDLARVNLKKSNYNHETYKHLYSQCIEHIHRIHGAGATSVVWCVPHLVPGRALYDISHAMRYIRDKLALGKFEVHVEGDNRLHVSWERSLKNAMQQAVQQSRASETPQKRAVPKKRGRDEPLAVKLRRMKNRLKVVTMR